MSRTAGKPQNPVDELDRRRPNPRGLEPVQQGKVLTTIQKRMSQFYEIDSTKVSHREYWWGSKSPLVLIGWMLKWLRVRIPGSSDDPNTESTLPFVIEQLPPEAEADFAALTAELNELGFGDPVYHAIHDAGTRTTVRWATFRHGTGQCFARIHQRIWQQANKSNRGLFPMFFTEFTDGTFFVSSAGKPDMTSPPTVPMNRLHKASAAALWEAHQRLAGEWGQGRAVVPANTREDLIAATERHHVLLRDFHLTRGVFRPRTTHEQMKADAFASSVAATQAGGFAHAEILAEMEKLQQQKPGWSTAVWVLVGSLVLFLAAGAAQWDWKFTLWLLPVLFIHEGGHWLAMRVFKYRNLRMFFIPFFGAAVTGQNWNVPGWKKALVSLAGPLPGIFLGAVLAVLALLLKKPWLNEAALIFLLVNGFNLLPVLPLDGGHVLHATLFCRNRWLDVTFRILAVLGLVGLSVAGFGKLFLYLAIAMGVSLPLAFKIGKVTDELRKSPTPPPLPDDDRISPTTAQAIISAVKAALPKGTSNKMVATQSVQVFETLNARPPGALATIGLLLSHAGGILVLILFGALMLVNKHGGLGDFFQAAIRQPEFAFACGDLQQYAGSAATATSRPETLLVATFDSHSKALTGFSGLTNDLPEAGRLLRFGNSLALLLPAEDDAAREKWYDRLQSLSTNLFVTPSNRAATLSFTFVAPTAAAATNLQRELKEYFEATTGMNLVPPWSPAAKAPGFTAQLQARREWKRIGREITGVWRDPAIEKINTQFTAASKRGARAEVKRLAAERQALVETLQAQALERLRNPATDGVNAELLDLHGRLEKLSYTNRADRAAVLRQVAARLGAESREDGGPLSSAGAYGVSFGMASQHGLMIEVPWANFRDVWTGLPAFTTWLCEQGCGGIHYRFQEVLGGLGENLDEDVEPEEP